MIFDFRDIPNKGKMYENIILYTKPGVCFYDKDVVDYLNTFIQLTLPEYQQELLKFNAEVINNIVYIKNLNDTKAAIEYLNEKYAVMINLMGY